MRLYKNYRFLLLAAMGITSFVMLIAESDSMGALAASKAVGFAMAWATYKLGKYWRIDKVLDETIKGE